MKPPGAFVLAILLVCVDVGAQINEPGAGVHEQSTKEGADKKVAKSPVSNDGVQRSQFQHMPQVPPQSDSLAASSQKQDQQPPPQTHNPGKTEPDGSVAAQAREAVADSKVIKKTQQELPTAQLDLPLKQQQNQEQKKRQEAESLIVSSLPLAQPSQDRVIVPKEDVEKSQQNSPEQQSIRQDQEQALVHSNTPLGKAYQDNSAEQDAQPSHSMPDETQSQLSKNDELHGTTRVTSIKTSEVSSKEVEEIPPASTSEYTPLSQPQSVSENVQQRGHAEPPQQQQPLPQAGLADSETSFPQAGGQSVEVEAAATTRQGDETPAEPEALTEIQRQALNFFEAGEKLINATYYKNYKEAYLNFLQAAELDHKKAKEYVAFGFLFGDYLPQNVTKSTELFNELADLGSPKAQMGLAFMYSAGFHYNSSQAKALIYMTFGALGGDPLAQMALGYRYYAGIGVESKCETALTYYRKVAKTVANGVTLAGGPVIQRIRLQEEAESQGTNNGPLLDDDLLQYYHFLADKGDQQAQIVLGTLYYQGGKGVQINHEQAYHYFSTAAESGSGHAMGYLGKMHSEGSPVVTQSNHTAFEYFKKSAEKNNHIGQTGLGMMYMNGLGVEKDTNKAFRYFSLASDQGSVDAQLQLGIMYFTGNGVRRDYKMAVKYFTMASQNGHVLAFYNLARMHATGTGVLRNCHTAVEFFKNVAERGRWSEMLMDAHRMYHESNVDTALVKYMFLAELGYEVAQSNVAYILDNGDSSKFSKYEMHQRALLQYSRAASQGSTHARLKMGDYHYYGLGTDIDYESAASHYRLASEQQHNAQAMFNLGYMHEKGLGLKQDVHLAKRFYDMAAETSLDAHIPVTLALLKLGIFYGVDIFSKEFEGVSGLLGMLNPAAYLGPDWDLYLATGLTMIFGALFYLRRMR